MSDNHAVLEYLQTQKASMTGLLQDLVLMETPSTDRDSQAQIRQRLKVEFEEIDYRVNLLPGRSSGGHVYSVTREPGQSTTRAVDDRSLRHGLADRYPAIHAAGVRG